MKMQSSVLKDKYFMSVFPESKLIDLTHPLTPDVPTWIGSCGFQMNLLTDHNQSDYRTQSLNMLGGIGTHIDAPSHFITNGASVFDLSIDTFFVNLHVIDVSKHAYESYHVGLSDLKNYEIQHGKINKQSLVVVHTGWSKFWNDSKRYANEDAVGQKRFPDLTADFAQALLDREVYGVGVDTLSPDSHDNSFPVHHLMLGNGKYILENLNNLYVLPPSGAKIIFLLLAIPDAAESPIRAIGISP